MKKSTKVLLIMTIALCIVVVVAKGITYAKYVSNTIWNYYLNSKDFYLSSDYLSYDNKVNVNNNWDLNNIHFNLKNSDNDVLVTEYDINYTVTCTTNDSNVTCDLNDTGLNTYTGTISNTKSCVNEIDTTDVSTLNKTACEEGGYTWKSVVVVRDIYFNLVSEGDINNVTVNIVVSSTSPYRKTLTGSFVLKKDKNIDGTIDSLYNDYTDYGLLIITNSYNAEKCIRVSFNSNNFRVETPLTNVNSYDVDESGYINKISFNILPKNNISFKFYKLNTSTYTTSDFTLLEYTC